MSNNRIASLEWGRILAIFAVITIHCAPFQTTPLIGEHAWFGMMLNQLSRFAVPFFFILAGYFIMPHLVAKPAETLKSYNIPLLKIWLAWSVIYLLIPFNLGTVVEQGYLAERSGYWDFLVSAPLNSLFEGGIVHLWFIPGLMCGLAIIGLLCHLKQTSLIIPTAIILYAYGLMAGSYQPLFGFEAPIFTRNGPFLSTLMITIGFETRRRDITVSTVNASALMLMGLALHLFEAKYLMGFEIPFVNHDFLIGTPFWAAGLFFLLIVKPTFGNNAWTSKWSKDVLGIYLCHLMIVIFLMNLTAIFGIEGIINDIIYVPLTFVISMMLTRLIRKTPLRHALLR
ncbi:acyltransferase family protein [uncultured Photobacterium sp.]|uniref:acyltransferase n=1 Tax=uncultured Photobacterium sp. TaxID=173973 RepID=UPI002635A106|nr:acyltransferase family protein [uncultured Photobacterium sp.]